MLRSPLFRRTHGLQYSINRLLTASTSTKKVVEAKYLCPKFRLTMNGTTKGTVPPSSSALMSIKTGGIFPIRGKGNLSVKFDPTYAAGVKCMTIRSFHITNTRRAAPLVWMILRPAMKVTAVLSGRAIRKWWQQLPKDKKTYFKDVYMRSRIKILVAVTGLTLLATLNYVVHLQEAPVTGRRRFIAFTDSQYSKIAEFEANLQTEVNKANFLPSDHPAVKAIQRVANRLYGGNVDIDAMKTMKFTVAVVDDDSNVNAFVLPTGHVFVFTGLLKMMENEDQLAVVLGHEMAHAILSHGVELVSRAQLIDMVAIIVLAAIWTFLPNDGIALVAQWFYNKVVKMMLEMPYSRDLEREADEVGLLLASKACFDVREAPVFWTFMSVQETLTNQKSFQWLSTHPSSDSRAERLNELMAQALDLRRERQCPRLSSKDPRAAIAQLHRLVEMKEKTGSTNTNVVVTAPSTAAGALMR